MDPQLKIPLFKGKEIRRIIHDYEWWFSVVDIIMLLTDSEDPSDYWYRMKKRELESFDVDLSTDCRQLKLRSSDNKKYSTDCATTETLLRIIQSIPSKNAEPFKRWLATVGYERIQEVEDPGVTLNRARDIKRIKKLWHLLK
jgi:DNA-damage-inducible protein D